MMDYAQASANAYQQNGAQALGGLNTVKQEPPRTLGSAASRMEALNERLSKASEALAMACNQIGAMTGLNGQIAGGNPNAPATGAVHRLNDLADDANAKVSTIEAYIASIQRALG